MPHDLVQPARILFQDGAPPMSADYGDRYHPESGAFAQAERVFLAGNGLPDRWARRPRFVVLETGFGLGNNYLATWRAWRRDAARCDRLVFVSIERHPPTLGDLRIAHRDSPAPELAQALIDAWPPLTPDLHRLPFDDGRVELLLALGDVAHWMRELVARVDAFFLDGFAPARNAQMWEPAVIQAMGRLASPGATVATWTAARDVRGALTDAGFEVRLAHGGGGKRDITLARYAPRFLASPPPGRAWAEPAEPHALIVGAGLAGCSVARALAEQGWRATLVDRAPDIAQGTSGNAAGLFHGIVNPDDGPHARFNRAASFEARRVVERAIRFHGVSGAVDGLLRLGDADVDSTAMTTLLDRLGLPPDYVQALDATAASELAGLPIARPAWFFPGGGWVHPAGLCRSALQDAGDRVSWRGGVHVHRLLREGDQWLAFDADGRVIAESETVVLANADDAARLVEGLTWPTRRVRGQVGQLPLALAMARGIPLPRMPIAGRGYLLPPVGDSVFFGATSQPGDEDPSVRPEDHRQNLERLQRLSGHSVASIPEDAMTGRTGWRWMAADRLPLIGAVPDLSAGAGVDQPRRMPRQCGLYVWGALASRGITWSALGAQVLAAQISGSPVPVGASLLDAVDPARFACRAVRRPPR